jgi:hypothetical protein
MLREVGREDRVAAQEEEGRRAEVVPQAVARPVEATLEAAAPAVVPRRVVARLAEARPVVETPEAARRVEGWGAAERTR